MLDFVVATHGGLYIVSLNSSRQVERSFLIDDGYHYGVTVDYDASSNTTLIYAYRGGPGRLEEQPREIRVWKFDGESVEKVQHYPLHQNSGDVHQITRYNNQLLIANSLYNSVDRWEPERGLVDRFYINDLKTDVNHINSILAVGNLWAIMLHNFRKLESQIVLLQESKDSISELGRFSLKDLCCHNIGILEDSLYINASSARAIVKINLKDLTETRREKFSAHTKGLCSDGDKIFAGMSDYASRAERVRSCGWINIVHPETLLIEDSVQVSEPSRGNAIGNINEIRLLNTKDHFDSASDVDPDLLKAAVNVPQNQISIKLRRFWIQANDKAKRLGRGLIGK